MCRRRILKHIANNNKVMAFSGEEGLKCGVRMDWMRLKHVSKYKTWNVFWMYQVQMVQNDVRRW